MSGKSVRVMLAVVLLALMMSLNIRSVTPALPDRQATPAIMVEEYSTTGS